MNSFYWRQATGVLSDSPYGAAIRSLDLKRNSRFSRFLQLLDPSGTPFKLDDSETAPEIRITLSQVPRAVTDALVTKVLTNDDWDEDTQSYLLEMDLSSTAIDTLLGIGTTAEKAQVPAWLEFASRPDAATDEDWTKSASLRINLQDDQTRLTDGPPAPIAGNFWLAVPNPSGSGILLLSPDTYTINEDGTISIQGTPGAGSGDVVGPVSAAANSIAVYNGTTGKIIKDGGSTIAALLSTAASDATTKANTAQSNAAAYTDTIAADKADLVAGVIPTAQIPEIAITRFLGSVSSQSAMLLLSGQLGDWCVRSDQGKNYVITGADPTQLANWTALSYPAAPVTSVNGQTGIVTLAKSDLSLGNVSNNAQLTIANNLSDLNSASTARTNLGLGTAAVAASTDFATAAQGTKADSADQSSWATLTGTTPALTFSATNQRIGLTISGSTTFTSSGYAAGRSIRLYLTPDTVDRALSFPAWTWLEGAPAQVTGNKRMQIDLFCTGTTAGSVFATYGTET